MMIAPDTIPKHMRPEARVHHDRGAPMTSYEACGSCRGSGLQDGLDGPVACSACEGQAMVQSRDERGRFAAPPEAFEEHR